MSLATHIKPISYLKANAAKIAAELKDDGEAYIITQNGEAAMVVQSVTEYEQTQETLAMLQLVAVGEQEIASGQIVTAKQAFASVRSKMGLSGDV
ncbi:MAG: type II toxin-antitoxin system Phd/YefM family antitoxin [Alteromonadaceae bacterium]|nr:type II toxin-antitoxin system Phd/YefM family antitoxin [Alteromonadaceae bacterium]